MEQMDIEDGGKGDDGDNEHAEQLGTDGEPLGAGQLGELGTEIVVETIAHEGGESGESDWKPIRLEE